ncbi:MAG: thiamine pyrophosphate-dependent dehydrogenase E1 component subunit alpha [Thermodesulfobacteriota bacterium]
MQATNVELYKKLYLIRRAEEKIQEHYSEDEMKTPMHMSMGEEAIVAGVCQALAPQDQVLGTWRTHALFLAKTGATDVFFAEMYGKAAGCARGRAGSMHLSWPEKGLLMCSAIVGTPLPVATGAALANKYRRSDRVVAVFFGDGAVDAGAFWESFNFACLKKLPILFVCEDNAFAVHTPRTDRHGFESICDVARQFRSNVFEADTTDAEEVYNLTRQAIAAMRDNGSPCFLQLHYYRYLEHVGVYEDFDAGYRSRDDFLAWRARDPVAVQRKKILQGGMVESELVQLEREIDEQITVSVKRAKSAECADPRELCDGVYKCGL